MRSVKIALAAIALVSFDTVSAQNQNAPITSIQAEGVSWMTEVGLTEDQLTRLKVSEVNYSEAQNALSKESGDHNALVARTQELRAAHDAEVKAILTPEQYVKMNAIQAAKRAAAVQQRNSSNATHNE